ncbi:hypothetical protein D3C80_1948810 [compost metagenome]
MHRDDRHWIIVVECSVIEDTEGFIVSFKEHQLRSEVILHRLTHDQVVKRSTFRERSNLFSEIVETDVVIHFAVGS